MPNWCLNYYDITFNDSADCFEGDYKKIQHLVELAERIDKVKNRGSRIGDEFVFWVEDHCNSKLPNPCLYGKFETKWAPLMPQTCLQFMERFPSVSCMEINFEEDGMGIYGKYCFVREKGGEISFSEYSADDTFMTLTCLRNSLEEGSYLSLEDASEKTGLEMEQIVQALEQSGLELGYFSNDTECFDPEDYFVLVR